MLSLIKSWFLTACLTVFFFNLHAQKSTEILWDKYGVPHIYATTSADMYYAYGWAQMQHHANLMLQLYGEARGKAAEYWGEKYFESDKRIHLFKLPDLSVAEYAQQKGETKNQLDAFVKGANDYANAHPEAIRAEMKKVLPLKATDVLSHVKRVIWFEFIAAGDIYWGAQEVNAGSNAYAIAPSRSASKNAMLLANPHLPWNGFFLFFEAHLNSPSFNAYGVSLVGSPTLAIAFNQHLGWTHTVNTLDVSDRYELELKEDGYVLDGKVLRFEKKSITLNVLKDGKLQAVKTDMLYSKHGPVVGKKGNKAAAVRIAALDNAHLFKQYHQMAKARNLKEFETAVKMMQMPMFNVIYADKDGHILYVFNGNIPEKKQGNWQFWSKKVDGTKSQYIWHSYHKYSDLPRLLDPETGFVQNANDPPWTSTHPSKLKSIDYPSYMSSIGSLLRPQRSIKMIYNDSSITFDELVDYKLNTGMEAADRFLDELLTATEKSGDSVVAAAADVLRKWDRKTDNESRGAVVYARWLEKLNPGTMFVNGWDPSLPITTPNGLKNPDEAVKLLKQAAEETIKINGSLDVKWGDVFRFKLGEHNYPANGGPGHFGIFRTMQFNDEGSVVAGDTYVAITEFGEKTRAKVLLSYGNATQPGNKHIGDQLKMLSEKKLRDAWLDKQDVIANMEKREELKTR